MTIIEPYKNSRYRQEFLIIGAFLFIFAILSIHFYNLNVHFKYEIALYEKEIQKLESMNADMRNKINEALDPKNLTALIEKHSLVPDKNPDYLDNKTLAQL